MKNRVVAVIASALLMTGLGAAPAQARTVTNDCRYVYSPNVVEKRCYVTYNWFERTFLLKQNGMEPVSIRFR